VSTVILIFSVTLLYCYMVQFVCVTIASTFVMDSFVSNYLSTRQATTTAITNKEVNIIILFLNNDFE